MKNQREAENFPFFYSQPKQKQMAKPNLFNSIKLTKPKKNVFDLSHDVKLSLNMGELVPILAMECIPGDKFNLSCESLLRFAPLVSPVMHRMDVTMHYFFVPNRILWPNWEKFITNTEVAGNLPAFPYLEIASQSIYSPLMDYMGIPDPAAAPFTGQPTRISALPFAAYQKIYNEYYRDQNLITAVVDILTDGDNVLNLNALIALRKRAWEHDYFTAALPFPQKGDAVDLPLGDVTLKPTWSADGDSPHFQTGAGVTQAGNVISDNSGVLDEIFVGANVDPNAYDPDGSLEVQPTTINDLRRAFRLQEWLERNARGGTRYVENILAHFGVRSSDKRLQRPEYITGTKSPVQISEVLNTSDTANAPQGNMAGHGVSVTSGKYGSYYCEEHGYIIGIMSVMPKTAYQQGIPRQFLKTNDPFEYYWPSFANIGEQEVQNRELYAFVANDTDTFGYVPRYAEYKYMPSRVAGEFRSSLDFWHLGRIFATTPALNQTFVEADPTTRVFAVTGGATQKLYAHVLNKIRAVRAMPKFGNPSF